MSLLLEALKKAELAKQSMKPAPQPDAPAPARAPVITRESLPDISQPLEILANDLPSAAPKRAPMPEARAPMAADFGAAPLSTGAAADTYTRGSPDFADRGAAAPGDAMAGDSAADARQAAARKVFEVKEMDYNPRRPFYIVIGVLVVCAAGYGGYVWWQMQPRALYSAAALKAAAENSAAAPARDAAPAGAPAAAPAAEPAATPGQPAVSQPQPAAATSPPSQAAATPATPPAANAAKGTPPPAARPTAPATPAAVAVAPAQLRGTAQPPAARRAQPSDAEGPARGSRSAIVVAPPTAAIDPQVERAYDAFQRGDLATARDQYQRALRQDPTSRDALLGLAAIDIRARDYEMAEARYVRLLDADPRDTLALAGLMALRGHIDPVQSESRLKSLIAQQPEAAQLHFALGNQFAAQRRWPEAQAAYFKAYSLDPENPDFAFNLAVSLDQIRQPKPALEYYRKAVALAGTKAAGFDRARAGARIAELTQP